ncbi:conserved hypothetical protein [Luminiphilus syltensis NOR5-1B]|uniref:Phospholipase n=1 Tax=Luminiphilus syltensis NOR5-1B TaxID=565045 RepID=B8KWT3_9GAMM|nr:conserved hypothetical protein [Luminiphilus syltensis NOR5-1B]
MVIPNFATLWQSMPGATALKRRLIRGLAGGLLLFGASSVVAWSDHASLVWPLVRVLPDLTDQSVPAETLESFVKAESEGLARMLEAQEQWSRRHLADYRKRPSSLRFDPRSQRPVTDFLEAIRVNPTLEYPLYRQLTSEDRLEDAGRLQFSDLSFLTPGVSHREVEYVPLLPGQAVAVAHVVASASDEPDFGIDVGLFSDNQTAFGARYGFGPQPFGNPNLDYGSQAPFHMGFYHLDWLVRTVQPQLLQTYPAWRIALYERLAQFAFDTGHPYWGWRFAGWALHYIGDLTQPYHAQPLPGVSTMKALWLVVSGGTADAIQLVSNRHGVLESYQHQRLTRPMQQGQWSDPLLQTIAEPEEVPSYHWSIIRGALTASSVAAGAGLDTRLETTMPVHLVSDPSFEWVGSGLESELIERLEAEVGADAMAEFDQTLMQQMGRFSRYARAWLQWTLAAQETAEKKDAQGDGNPVLGP